MDEHGTFELIPIAVAAVLGAVVLYMLTRPAAEQSTNTLATGAAVGVVVQIGVRLIGVS